MSVLRQASRCICNRSMRAGSAFSLNFVGSCQPYRTIIKSCAASEVFPTASFNFCGPNKHHIRLLSVSRNVNGIGKLGEISPRIAMAYKCNVCGSRNTQAFSKQAYTEGVVILQCETCKSNHLVADNLGWFEDVNKRNIEEILAAKGERVTKLSSFSDIPTDVLEKLNSNSAKEGGE